MAAYDIGDAPVLSTTVRNAAGAPTNATVALAVTKPDQTVVNPTITNVGTGLYEATVPVDQAGTWLYKWTASGAVVSVDADQFEVVAQRVRVASLAELKHELDITTTDRDDDLRMHLGTATDYVEWAIGPLSVRTVTERQWASGDGIAPRLTPLVSVTSVTPIYSGTTGPALSANDFYADLDTGVITLWWPSYGRQCYQIVYRAGYSAIPDSARQAGILIAQHQWQTQNGGGGLPFPGDDGLETLPGNEMPIPRRAAYLLKVMNSALAIPGIA